MADASEVRAAYSDRDLQPRSLQAEVISEPVKPPPITSTRSGPAASRSASPPASSRVRSVNTPSRAASSALGQGRARVPVAIH
ncbi:hypothetical protein SAMN05442782_10723 [Streptomyces sp. OK228]|nr:hypothetical protein SAMN05442782_10723 [Streptomyces sp. OK228]